MENSRHTEESYKVQNRNFYAMVFMALFHGFGQSMFNIVYQPFLYEFVGDSIFLTGILITLGSLIFILPLPWVGRLSDRFGRKLVWYIGEPFIILGLFSFIFANNMLFLILGVISYSFGNLILNIIYLVFVSENSPESKRGFNFGLIFFALFVGNIAGSSFVLIDLGSNVRIYFALFIVVILINIIILVFIIKEPKELREKKRICYIKKIKSWEGNLEKNVANSKK